MAKSMEIKLAIFYITGVEPDKGDPDRVNDAVYGSDFYLSMDKAAYLARHGVHFRTFVPYSRPVDVKAHQSPLGNWYLKTSPDARIANNLGYIKAKRSPLNAFLTPPIKTLLG